MSINLAPLEKNELPAKERNVSEIANRCAGVARNLTYNDDTPQAQAKHALREAAHFIDSQIVRLHKKRDGLLAINARGKSRFLTVRERLAVWLLRGKTEVRP